MENEKKLDLEKKVIWEAEHPIVLGLHDGSDPVRQQHAAHCTTDGD